MDCDCEFMPCTLSFVTTFAIGTSSMSELQQLLPLLWATSYCICEDIFSLYVGNSLTCTKMRCCDLPDFHKTIKLKKLCYSM